MDKPDFEALTKTALSEPGRIHEAYSSLHEFSISNQMLAMMQMAKIEPIASFNAWKEVGRPVQKGAKGIALMMPIFKKAKQEVSEREDRGPPVFYQMRRYWFKLSDTAGAEYVPPPIPGFDQNKMLSELKITQEPFQSLSGNCMGYAKTAERKIAVSPLAFDAFKTAAHEVCHCLIHPDTINIDSDRPEKAVREIEAELGAFLVCSALGKTENLVYARGYIQSYLDDTTVEKVRFPKVYGAADQILKAGQITP